MVKDKPDIYGEGGGGGGGGNFLPAAQMYISKNSVNDK